MTESELYSCNFKIDCEAVFTFKESRCYDIITYVPPPTPTPEPVDPY